MKYKLIKKYPKSPPVGTIVEIKNDGYCSYKMSEDYGNLSTHLHKDVIKDYPEFWEKVVEIEYEVLSFKQNSGITDLWTKFGTNYWCRNHIGQAVTSPYTYSAIVNSPLYSIHSVRRLSDGEVFTVGNIVTERLGGKKNVTIEAFNIHTNNLIITASREDISFTTVALSLLDKVKKPLFKTEDGVDVFEGDVAYSVFIETLDTDYRGTYPSTFYPNPKYKYFSSEVEAEYYILKNKPCLSINDVIKSYTWDAYNYKDSIDTTVNDLIKLIKQKK